MAKVTRDIQDKNAHISLRLLSKYDNEFINCTQIAYYVDGNLLFKNTGEIMVNRRDSYPKLQILVPGTDNYTSSFQENSCVFTDLGNLDIIKIETSYTPYFSSKQIDVTVIITF